MAFNLVTQKGKLYKHAQGLLQGIQTRSLDNHQATQQLDSLCRTEFITPFGREDLDQALFRQFYMAVNTRKFEVNDHATVVYWLTEARYIMTSHEYNRLGTALLEGSKKLTTQSLMKLLWIYATVGYVQRPVLNNIISTLLSKTLSTSDLVRVAFCLCVLGDYKSSFWRGFKYNPRQVTPDLHQNIRIILCALECEAPSLLSQPTAASLNMQKMLESSLEVVHPEVLTTGSKPVLKDSQMHREVRIVIKSILDLEEFFNTENIYISDFGSLERRGFVDIDGPAHYFRTMGPSDPPSALIGQVQLKYRLLKRKGWRQASIPYFEWNQFPDKAEKRLYLRRLLRLSGFLG